MRLTDTHHSALRMTLRRPLTNGWALVAVGLGLLGVFLIDRATAAVPFQHLYYLPIIFAALQFGRWGGWVSALAAVALYHLANPALLRLVHGERDVVQIALFVGVGVVTARLHEVARRLEALASTDDLTGLFEAVRTVGHLIQACLPPAAFACRYGGDEFVIALPGRPGPGADETASAILGSVRGAAPVLAPHQKRTEAIRSASNEDATVSRAGFAIRPGFSVVRVGAWIAAAIPCRLGQDGPEMEPRMKSRKLATLLLLALPLTLAGANSAWSQVTTSSGEYIQPQIFETAFPFEAGGKALPAGKYDIEQPTRELLIIRPASRPAAARRRAGVRLSSTGSPPPG